MTGEEAKLCHCRGTSNGEERDFEYVRENTQLQEMAGNWIAMYTCYRVN